MSTLGTLKTRILDELNRDDLTSAVQSALVTAVDFHNDEVFAFKEDRATAPTVASQEFYPLPPGFVMPLPKGLMITTNNYRYPLSWRTVGWLNEYYTAPSQYTGRPEDYTVQDGMIRLYPIPNAVYELTMHYYRSHEEVSASASDSATSTWLTGTQGDLLRVAAKRIIYADYIHDQKKQVVMEREEARYLMKLRARQTKRVATGRINRQML